MKFKVGDIVRVKDSVDRPKFGWGDVRREDIGRVVDINSYGELIINFKAWTHWTGIADEVELVNKEDLQMLILKGKVKLDRIVEEALR